MHIRCETMRDRQTDRHRKREGEQKETASSPACDMYFQRSEALFRFRNFQCNERTIIIITVISIIIIIQWMHLTE